MAEKGETSTTRGKRRAGEAKKGNRGRNRTSHHLILDRQPVSSFPAELRLVGKCVGSDVCGSGLSAAGSLAVCLLSRVGYPVHPS